jgi:spermidine synthase
LKTYTIRQRLLLSVFYVSGFAALLYQVVWQRWLVFYTGISSVSISLIVSAFMAGLGLGYLVGGIIADRAKANRPILYFVFAELGIGLFAIFSKFFIYDLLYSSSLIRVSGQFQTYTLLFLILLFPTFLMGLSLPLLSKSFKLNNLANQAHFISHLYFVNTLGAASGAFVTSLVLIRLMGFEWVVILGASFNFLCALVAGAIYQQQSQQQNLPTHAPKSTLTWGRDLRFWMAQYFVSGFVAICFEIIWFRILEVTIKSTAMTFALVLSVYLLSMAIGTRFGISYLQKTKRNLLSLFLMSQYWLYAYSIGAIVLFFVALKHWDSMSFLMQYFGNYDVVYQPKILVFSYVIIPIFLMSIPTFLMGFSFSISQNIIQNNYEQVGRKVGWLQFINIVGSILGAWFVTLVGFNYLGTSLTIKLLTLFGFVYLLLTLQKRFVKFPLFVSLTTILMGAIWTLPNSPKFWEILGGQSQSNNIILREDDTAISSIKFYESIPPFVCVNGLGQSLLPYNADEHHVALGGIPSMIHPNPQDIAIIGLGSGGTLFSAASRQETKQIDCFEVIVNQPDILWQYARRTNDSAVMANLKDSRVKLILQDGRYVIHNSPKQYDIIEADALRPQSPYSGNVYSVEYFAQLKNKLKTGGMVVSWMPTERVKNTVMSVFDYVYLFNDFMLVCSNSPLTVSRELIENRLKNDFTQSHFAKAHIDFGASLKPFIEKIEVLQNGQKLEKSDLNTDMFPKDEYDQLYRLAQRIGILSL